MRQHRPPTPPKSYLGRGCTRKPHQAGSESTGRATAATGNFQRGKNPPPRSHGTPGWDETTSMAAICKAMELASLTRQRSSQLTARLGDSICIYGCSPCRKQTASMAAICRPRNVDHCGRCRCGPVDGRTDGRELQQLQRTPPAPRGQHTTGRNTMPPSTTLAGEAARPEQPPPAN